MKQSSQWNFFGHCADGQRFEIQGVNVWDHEWIDTKERVNVKDPLYGQSFTFHIYEIVPERKKIRFATGEFSNCMRGFYLPIAL